MKKEKAEFIMSEYMFDISMRDDYSGRNMYGKETYGIVGSESDLEHIEQNIKHDSDGEFDGKFRWDNMGLQYIIY